MKGICPVCDEYVEEDDVFRSVVGKTWYHYSCITRVVGLDVPFINETTPLDLIVRLAARTALLAQEVDELQAYVVELQTRCQILEGK